VIERARDAATERRAHPSTDRRTDRLTDADPDEEPDDDQERARERIEDREGPEKVGQEQETDGQRKERPGEPEDLRQGTGSEAGDRAQEDEQDRDDVEDVHERMVAEDPMLRLHRVAAVMSRAAGDLDDRADRWSDRARDRWSIRAA
jgi:hypothetical protein